MLSFSCIKAWDIRKLSSLSKSAPTPVHTLQYAGPAGRARGTTEAHSLIWLFCNHMISGFSSLVFDSTKSRLFANCMDHHVYAYDCVGLTQKPSKFKVASNVNHMHNIFSPSFRV
jgi:hypothetical protein